MAQDKPRIGPEIRPPDAPDNGTQQALRRIGRRLSRVGQGMQLDQLSGVPAMARAVAEDMGEHNAEMTIRWWQQCQSR